MRYGICFLFFLFAFEVSSAQDLKITVQDRNGSLPYAAVYINNRQYSITDSLGVTLIPLERLTNGDTLSSSYIGMVPVSLIYDHTMEASRACTLMHTEEETYLIESVAVTQSIDPWKFFRKQVNTHQQLMPNCIVRGNFSLCIHLSNDTVKTVSGSFSLKNQIPPGTSNEDIPKYYFNFPTQINTLDDTTGINHALVLNIGSIFVGACAGIGELNIARYSVKHPYSCLSYLGVKDDHHYFRFTTSNPSYPFNAQLLFSVNKQTKEIESIKFFTTTRTSKRYSLLNLSYVCELSKTNSTFLRQVMIPTYIEGTVERDAAPKWEGHLSDITVEYTK